MPSHTIEIDCNLNNSHDIIAAILHSILFFRCCGKFRYKHESGYSIGSLGFEEIDCDQLEFTYIRCACDELNSRVEKKLQEFTSKLGSRACNSILQLDFFTKKGITWWLFNESKIIWESWVIKISFNPTVDYLDLQQQPSSQRQVRMLRNRIMDIIAIVNSEPCSMGHSATESDYENIFDPNYAELQPYHFSLTFKISDYKQAPAAMRPRVNSCIDMPISSSGRRGSDDPLAIGAASYNTNNRRSSIQKFLIETLEL